MAHVVTAACIDCKDGACVQCCPVDCIYEGQRSFYIHPDECIDCGVCISFCPPAAIHDGARLPEVLAHFRDINREFFGSAVSGLGSPGGASEVGPVQCDHPFVSTSPSGVVSPHASRHSSIPHRP
jgi:NAD-dependent dihydropyrimidine dehydrogenase PreA subunit